MGLRLKKTPKSSLMKFTRYSLLWGCLLVRRQSLPLINSKMCLKLGMCNGGTKGLLGMVRWLGRSSRRLFLIDSFLGIWEKLKWWSLSTFAKEVWVFFNTPWNLLNFQNMLLPWFPILEMKWTALWWGFGGLARGVSFGYDTWQHEYFPSYGAC